METLLLVNAKRRNFHRQKDALVVTVSTLSPFGSNPYTKFHLLHDDQKLMTKNVFQPILILFRRFGSVLLESKHKNWENNRHRRAET